MNCENFCYWLQGLLELEPNLTHLNEDQVKMIREHLGYVFPTAKKSSAKEPTYCNKDLSTIKFC